MKIFNFLICSFFAQNPWDNLVNIDDPRSCIICNQQGARTEVYDSCRLSGTIKKCRKYQTCEFTERKNNGLVQIVSQCKQKRACNNSVAHNKNQCKKRGKKDQNGVLVSSTCRQCFPNALLFTQVLDMLNTGSYPHTMFNNDLSFYV